MTFNTKYPRTSGPDPSAVPDSRPLHVQFRERAEAERFATGIRMKHEAERLSTDLVAMRQIEKEHTERRKAASTDEERRIADGLLADIKQQIRKAHKEHATVTATKTAKEIRAWRDAELARIAEALAASQHEGYTKEYRELERTRLTARYRQVEADAEGRMAKWAQDASAQAQLMFHADPDGDAAEETRRLRREMQVRAVVEEFQGAGRTQITNRVLSEAKRYISMGVFDSAYIQSEAARRLGVVDDATRGAIEEHFNQTVPHRRAAIEQQRAIADERYAFEIAQREDRVKYGIGSRSELARDASQVEYLRWKQQHEGELVAQSEGEATPAQT